MPRNRNKTYEEQRISRIRSYGITEDQHDYLVATQNGVCYLCHKKDENKALAIDHDHKTGRVRGLLCSACNRGLGLLKDDPDLVLKAYEYLSKDPDWDIGYWKSKGIDPIGARRVLNGRYTPSRTRCTPNYQNRSI